MCSRSFSVVLIGACTIFAVRAALVLWLIPPWQQPDEPAHVAISEVWRGRLLGIASDDPGRENEILHSMARYQWWQHYGAAAPAPIPPRFVFAGDTLGIDPRVDYPVPYYSVAGALLSLTRNNSVVGDLRTLRIFSAALSLLTIYAAWRGTREVLGTRAAAVVTILLALQMQFVLVASAVGADAWVNALAACVWWQIARALRKPSVVKPLVFAWVAAALAAASDRMGVPLILSVGFASMVALSTRSPSEPASERQSRILRIVALIGAVAILIALDVTWGTFRNEFRGQLLIPVDHARTWKFFVDFSTFLFQSWWASIGWVRYFPPTWWSGVVFAMTLLAVVGLVKYIAWDRKPRTVVVLAALFLATQVAAEYWAYYRLGYGPQGKHLFPAIVPSLTLFWLGLESFGTRKYAAAVAVALIVGFAVLDSALWMLVVIPAYWTI